MREDVYSGHGDFWRHVETHLDELGAQFGVPPLEPAMAALDDEDVRPDAVSRPGLPPPPAISTTRIADHPPTPQG